MIQQQHTPFVYHPVLGWSKEHVGTYSAEWPDVAARFRVRWSTAVWAFNPWTGDKRNGADVQSDPYGLLIIPPGEEMVAAAPRDEGPAPAAKTALLPALARQEGGDHYKGLKIQPAEYMHANNIPFMEGCAIKYLTRWRSKGGIGDLKKARHFIDLLIELEAKADGHA